MKVFIVGSNGFLGSNLKCSFLKNNYIVIDAPSIVPYSRDYKKWIQAVITDLQNESPDVVCVAGASQNGGDDIGAAEELFSCNILLLSAIAHALLEVQPRAHLIHFGTSWQNCESDTFRPFNLYAASKQAAEIILTHYALKGLKIGSLRLFDTYGPADTRKKILNLIYATIKNGEHLAMTEGNQEVDLVHIIDVCSAVHAINAELTNWTSCQGVMIRGSGGGIPITVKELVKRVEKKTGATANITFGDRPYRDREPMTTWKSFVKPKGWSANFTDYMAI